MPLNRFIAVLMLVFISAGRALPEEPSRPATNQEIWGYSIDPKGLAKQTEELCAISGWLRQGTPGSAPCSALSVTRILTPQTAEARLRAEVEGWQVANFESGKPFRIEDCEIGGVRGKCSSGRAIGDPGGIIP